MCKLSIVSSGNLPNVETAAMVSSARLAQQGRRDRTSEKRVTRPVPFGYVYDSFGEQIIRIDRIHDSRHLTVSKTAYSEMCFAYLDSDLMNKLMLRVVLVGIVRGFSRRHFDLVDCDSHQRVLSSFLKLGVGR